MSKSKESSAVFNILAFTFDGKDDAEETVKQIKKSGALEGQMIVAEAIVSVDAKGKLKIHRIVAATGKRVRRFPLKNVDLGSA